jgi:hypothetical protein
MNRRKLLKVFGNTAVFGACAAIVPPAMRVNVKEFELKPILNTDESQWKQEYVAPVEWKTKDQVNELFNGGKWKAMYYEEPPENTGVVI